MKFLVTCSVLELESDTPVYSATGVESDTPVYSATGVESDSKINGCN